MEVEIEYNGSRVTLQSDLWSGSAPEIEIFDSVFVETNVFSGSTVLHEHKKNLFGFALGDAGVQLAKDVDAIADEIRLLNENITKKTASIMPNIQGGVGLDLFLGSPVIVNIDAEIRQKNVEIEALKNATAIQTKPQFSKIILPSIPTAEIVILLSKELETVSQDAERKTKEHINSCMDAHGESWLERGLGYVKDEICPFCGQNINGSTLLIAYQGYFSEEYERFKIEVGEMYQVLFGAMSPDLLSAVQHAIMDNKRLNDFWQPLIADAVPEIHFSAFKDAWDLIFGELKKQLEQKQGDPLTPFVLNQNCINAGISFQSQIAIVNSYNEKIEILNKLILAKKTSVAGGNLSLAERDLYTLMNSKNRHLPAINILCQEYISLNTQKTAADTRKEAAKTDLETYTRTFLQEYGEKINEHLHDFGVDFRISEPAKSLQGGKTSIAYGLVINGASVDIVEQPSSIPSLSNTLSTGDKTTLAFAFFLARLHQDPNLDQKVIVIDDPISSLDIFRQFRTHELVLEILEKAKQVIVFSHEPRFLSMIAVGCPDEIPNSQLQIVNVGGKSEFKICNVVTEAQSQDLQDLKKLSDFLRYGASDESERRSVAKCIRTLVESQLKMRYTAELGSSSTLGRITNLITAAQIGSSLYALKPLLTDLESINAYAKRYHHNNPSAPTAAIDPTELETYTKKSFDVIGELYKIH